MRTAIFIAAGLLLWAAFLGVAKFSSGTLAAAGATKGFIVVWFFAAAVNLWVGVSKAGYAFSEELPIFLLIFFAPAAVAALVQWKWL
jgi:hypothetical protein